MLAGEQEALDNHALLFVVVMEVVLQKIGMIILVVLYVKPFSVTLIVLMKLIQAPPIGNIKLEQILGGIHGLVIGVDIGELTQGIVCLLKVVAPDLVIIRGYVFVITNLNKNYNNYLILLNKLKVLNPQNKNMLN